MTPDLFTRLLDTFGADFRRWPEAQRQAGEAFRDAIPAALAQWQAAQRLDALFALDRAPATDPAQVRAIADAALRRVRARPEPGFDWRLLWSKPIGAALAASLAAGLLAGFTLGPDPQPPPERGVPAVAVLLGYDVTDFDGVL